MSEFKTLKEWFGDATRGDGRKFQYTTYASYEYFEPIFLDDSGYWHGLDEEELPLICEDSQLAFKLYVKPKKTRSVMMFKPICKAPTNSEYWCPDSWNSRQSNFHGSDIVGWLTWR
jgi:hypothetical protein